MKWAKLNIEKYNALFHPFETDENFEKRQHVIVPDDYDFNDNADEDVTNDVTVWDKHGDRLHINYVHILKKIREILTIKSNPNYPTLDFSGMDNLSNEEKLIGCKYFVFPHPIRVSIVSDEQDNEAWNNLLENSKIGRIALYEEMRRKAGDEIRTATDYFAELGQNQHFYTDTYELADWFQETNHPAFKAWLCSTSVTVDGEVYDYTSNGFASKNYFEQSILDDLLDIYDGNNYA